MPRCVPSVLGEVLSSAARRAFSSASSNVGGFAGAFGTRGALGGLGNVGLGGDTGMAVIVGGAIRFW